MEIPVYLAMTAAEFRTCSILPAHFAWLSCLFSPYGRGLSNIPKQLPPNSLLILSDRTPPNGHDANLIYETLKKVIAQLNCTGLLLDFEQRDNPEIWEIVRALTALPCPVAVTTSYASGLDCPVFVPSLSPLESLETHIAPWRGREIWVEVSAQAQEIIVTESGSTIKTCATSSAMPHADQALSCHYAMELHDKSASFTLQRNKEDWIELLSTHRDLGITNAVGLYQEIG